MASAVRSILIFGAVLFDGSIAVSLVGCGEQPALRDHPEFASAPGVATMGRDRVITIQLPPVKTPDVEGRWEQYRPGEPMYEFTLKEVGGLLPGQTKPLPPVP